MTGFRARQVQTDVASRRRVTVSTEGPRVGEPVISLDRPAGPVAAVPSATVTEIVVTDPINSSPSDLAPAAESPVGREIFPHRSRPVLDYRLRGLDVGGHSAPPPPDRQSAPRNRLGRRSRRRLAMKWAVVLVTATLVAVLLRIYVALPYSVPSTAMLPTFQAGDRILVVKARLLAGPIKRGDIVVFRRPARYRECDPGAAPGTDLVQRVVAMPGQTIWSSRGSIFINGRELRERGWYNSKSGPLGRGQVKRTTVPVGDYFVLGDNRAKSCDSRSFGAIPGSLVVGKVVGIVWRHNQFDLHLF